jgi:hypothetical protein
MNLNLDSLNLNSENEDNIKAIKIQSWWRGCHLRKILSNIEDNMTFQFLGMCLNIYNTNLKINAELNELLSKKKIRNENFPSHISENIAKFAIMKKYHVMPCWDTDKGDLVINKIGLYKQLEVKGFMSSGPSSFGPTEKWDILYFVDAKDTMNNIFKVYEIKLSNKDDTFRNIKLSKNETYGEVADSKRRPRGCFEKTFKSQLGKDCKLIFDGHISELNNTF